MPLDAVVPHLAVLRAKGPWSLYAAHVKEVLARHMPAQADDALTLVGRASANTRGPALQHVRHFLLTSLEILREVTRALEILSALGPSRRTKDVLEALAVLVDAMALCRGDKRMAAAQKALLLDAAEHLRVADLFTVLVTSIIFEQSSSSIIGKPVKTAVPAVLAVKAQAPSSKIEAELLAAVHRTKKLKVSGANVKTNKIVVESLCELLHLGTRILRNDRELTLQQRERLIGAVIDAACAVLDAAVPEDLLMHVVLASPIAVDLSAATTAAAAALPPPPPRTVIQALQELCDCAAGPRQSSRVLNSLLASCLAAAGIAPGVDGPATRGGKNAASSSSSRSPAVSSRASAAVMQRVTQWVRSGQAKLPVPLRAAEMSLFTHDLPSSVLLALVAQGMAVETVVESSLGSKLSMPQLLLLATNAVPLSPTSAAPIPKVLIDKIATRLALPRARSSAAVYYSAYIRGKSDPEALGVDPQQPADPQLLQSAAPVLLAQLVLRGQVDEAVSLTNRLLAGKLSPVAALPSTMLLIQTVLGETTATPFCFANAAATAARQRASLEVLCLLTPKASECIKAALQRNRLSSAYQPGGPPVAAEDHPSLLLSQTMALVIRSAAVGAKFSSAKVSPLVALLADVIADFVALTRAEAPVAAAADITAVLVEHCADIAAAVDLRTARGFLHDAAGCLLAQIERVAASSGAASSADEQPPPQQAAVIRLREHQVLHLAKCFTVLYGAFSVEVERAALQSFRARILEPAMAALMQHRVNPAVVGMFARVACNAFTAFAVSDDFIAALVEACRPWKTAKSSDVLRSIAADILVASASVATSVERRDGFGQLMTLLCKLVKPTDAVKILAAAAGTYDRANTSSVLPPEIGDLALAIGTVAQKPGALPLKDVVDTLRHLHRLGLLGAEYGAPLVERLHGQSSDLTLGQCGVVAGLVTRFPSAAAPSSGGNAPEGANDGTASAEDRTTALLRGVKARVLDGRLTCPVADVPLVVRGFSMLAAPALRPMQQAVLAAYILRVMTITPTLDAPQVVRCLQSFISGEVVHSSLFGLLLSRAADLKAMFSIALAVDFVQCAVAAVYDEGTQKACVTAAQSVFLFVVSHLLVNDLAGTLRRGRNAELLLGCLEAVAPRDRLSDDVLKAASTVIADLPVPGVLAAVSLIASRFGCATDLNAFQTITRHCMDVLIPTADTKLLSQMVLLLVRAGSRGAALFTQVEKRCEVLLKDFDGPCVASICDAYQEARYENTELIAAIVNNLVPKFAPTMTAAQVLSVMSVMFSSRTQHAQAHYALFGRVTEVATDLDAAQVTAVLKIAGTTRHSRNRRFSAAIAQRVETLAAAYESPFDALHVAHNLVRVKAHHHPIVHRLLDIVFANRGLLLKRQLLMELAQNIFACEDVTPDLHPMLHAFAVKGDIIMTDGKAVSLENVAVGGEGQPAEGEAAEAAAAKPATFGKLFSIPAAAAAASPAGDKPSAAAAEAEVEAATTTEEPQGRSIPSDVPPRPDVPSQPTTFSTPLFNVRRTPRRPDPSSDADERTDTKTVASGRVAATEAAAETEATPVAVVATRKVSRQKRPSTTEDDEASGQEEGKKDDPVVSSPPPKQETSAEPTIAVPELDKTPAEAEAPLVATRKVTRQKRRSSFPDDEAAEASGQPAAAKEDPVAPPAANPLPLKQQPAEEPIIATASPPDKTPAETEVPAVPPPVATRKLRKPASNKNRE